MYAQIEIIDDASLFARDIKESENYLDYLNRFAGRHNQTRKMCGLERMKLDIFEYQRIKDNIDSYDILSPEQISKVICPEIHKIAKIIGSENLLPLEKIKIFIFLNENFDGQLPKSDIAFCANGLDHDCLKRVLVHEIIHWFHLRLSKTKISETPECMAIYEGIASYVTEKVCACSESDALLMTEKVWNNCKKDDFNLKKSFLEKFPEPFNNRPENLHNRYGYYIGYHFVEFCIKNNLSIHEIIGMNNNQILALLKSYLN